MLQRELAQHARAKPNEFWAEAAEGVSWYKKPQIALDESAQIARWFPGGELNMCFNAVDRHVEAGHGERTAIIYDSPVAQAKRRVSYQELQTETAKLAGALRGRGVMKGDRVVIYMPMIPEAVVAMLACARIGAVHSVVFGGFAAPELAARIEDATPKAIIAASCGIEPNRLVAYQPLLEEALNLSKHQPDFCLIKQRPQKPVDYSNQFFIDLDAAMAEADEAPCAPVKATDPLYILYTSGTTGKPKGMVRDTGGYAVALHWSMRNVYDVKPGEVFWAASDIGWVVGHSYIVYGPLLNGDTTVIYEGKPVGTPDAGAFWRVAQEYKVRSLFTAPTAIRAIRQQDPQGEHIKKYDLASLRSLFLAGERCDPDTLIWAREKLQVPTIDHWWQTETGWSICANCLGIERSPVKPGAAGLPVPGWDIHILDPDGHPAPAGDVGAIVGKLPMPPGSAYTLWNAHERFLNTYFANFPGFYETGDAGIVDEDGYVHIMARTDDIINVAGHRLSTGAMEEVLVSHPHVAEAAVVGAKDALKGQTPYGFVVLAAGCADDHAKISAELVALVREKIGPVAAFKNAAVVQKLPKTRSGKILRATIRKIVDDETYVTPATIEDPQALDVIKLALGE